MSFQVIHELVLLLIERIKDDHRHPKSLQSEFHDLCCSLVDATANGPRPDSPLWDDLSALFKRILQRTCADDQQQMYSNFLVELEAVRVKSVDRRSLSPDAFGAWLRTRGQIALLERERKELENQKAANEDDVALLAAHLERQSQRLAEDTADAVVTRANRMAGDLVSLIESLNDELKLPD
jgi:hypothetical protein